MTASRRTPTWWARATAIGVALWAAVLFLCRLFDWPLTGRALWEYGLIGLFFVGLVWAVWWVERLTRQRDRARREQTAPPRSADPFDLRAWYYGRSGQKLKQSLLTLATYSLAFMLFVMMAQMSGCQSYELPAGGGQDQIQQQVVKIQKVERKKFVVNPYSAILFNPPPIDQVDPQILEVTKNLYQVGQGQGEGAGFSGGTSLGRVRFIRLQYDGGDWDKDMGIGSDLNMLIEFGIRTRMKVAERTESMTTSQLAAFPARKSPPVIYVTGQKSILLSNADKRILKSYLFDKHGMLFGSNAGSRQFHDAFVSLCREVTGVKEVPVPLDDLIHRRPYQIPFLPIVAPHGGREALGWRVDGRWLAYYHPGDIHDAWADGHAGVRPEVWEACYQLGVNIIYYAHAEYNQWLQSSGK
jgi:hypothetical protein